MDEMQKKIVAEKEAFERLRPDLMRDHTGKFVLVKDGQVHGLFPSHRDAYAAGIERFGVGQVFLVEELADRPQPSVSLTWELGLVHVVR